MKRKLLPKVSVVVPTYNSSDTIIACINSILLQDYEGEIEVIIIDDGSHITSHQQKSLGYLFPLLNTNGIYICEDLHTSYVQSYIDTSSTTLELLEKYKKTKILECDIISSERLKYINANIVDIILYERNVNAPKCYKCNTINNNDDECRNCSTNLSPQDKSITSILFHK